MGWWSILHHYKTIKLGIEQNWACALAHVLRRFQEVVGLTGQAKGVQTLR